MLACVTGGSGFIGRHLVDLLVREGHRVRLLSRKPGTFPQTAVEVVQGDLLSELPSRLFSAVDAVFHCAGEVSDESRMRELHVAGTERLLHAARAEVRASDRHLHWVQLSSVGAYGPLRHCRGRVCRVTEACPEDPVGEYELTKTMADRMLLETSAQEPRITATVLRPSNVFGPGMPNDSVRSLLKAMSKGWFFAIGRDEGIATYVHVDDVAAALLLCGTDPRARGETYILSNDCEFSRIAAAIAAAENRRPTTLRVPEILIRMAARVAGLLISHPLSTARIDTLTRRIHYASDRLGELGFCPRRDVPQAMVEFWKLERERL